MPIVVNPLMVFRSPLSVSATRRQPLSVCLIIDNQADFATVHRAIVESNLRPDREG